MRPMDLYVTGRAVCVLRILVMLGTSRLNRAYVMRHAVASKAKLIDCTEPQQPRIGRAVRGVTSRATFRLQRRMFVGKGSLLVGVALDASRISAGGKSCLLQLKTAMRVMTVTAFHRAFENFVMERHAERRLHFTVTTKAKLRLTYLQHLQGREAGLFGIRTSDEDV